MKKSALVIGVVLLAVSGFFVVKALKKSPPSTTPADNVKVELPLNTLPLTERPFITLQPDSLGRSLGMTVSGAPTTGELEYEMIYNASGKQEGALGTIFLATEKQPLTKSILLGSKSGGGKVTYHEGVTGGSLTVTYGETRLKESWNFLKFDPADPTISSTDGRFLATLGKTALKKDAVIVTMKTFGYAKTGLTDAVKVVAGPYAINAQSALRGSFGVSLKLPAGEHVNPTLYGYNGTTWAKLTTKLVGETVTATAPAPSGVSTLTAFLVTAD